RAGARSSPGAHVGGRLAPAGPAPARLAAALAAHDDPSATELAWLRARYGEIGARAAAAGARFAVVVVPYSTQLDGKVGDHLERRLVALGDEAGWVTIDLLPAFREATAPGEGPLFIDLWHPTAAGQRVAAEALLAQLACRGLLPLPAGTGCPAPS